MAAVSNFTVLRRYEEQLWRLGALAERYFAEDPNTCLLKLRQFAELLAQTLAARTALYLSPDESRHETQLDLLRRLRSAGVLPNEPFQMFDAVRRLIADKLDEAGITYHYELPLDMGGVTRYPDFTIKDDDSGVTCYWEHLGLMNTPQYVARWKRKEAAYRAMGVVPATEFEYGKFSGVLVTTVEDGERRDLSEQIDAVVAVCKEGFF